MEFEILFDGVFVQSAGAREEGFLENQASCSAYWWVCASWNNLNTDRWNGWQLATTFYFHGYAERHFCAIHYSVHDHVLFLSLFRGQFNAHPLFVRSVISTASGIPQEPIFDRWPTVYAICSMEIPGIQWATPYLYSSPRRVISSIKHVYWSVSQREDDDYHAVGLSFIGELICIKCCCSFVAFIAGSFAAVLVLASVLDPDLVLHFEITPHRTVLFYLGVFGSILAAVRGTIPEENRVFDPELLMTEVIEYTHYMPDEWKDQLHSKRVR